MADITLQRPQAGQVLALEPQADQNINLEFAADEALLSRDGENLIFSFEDGSSIELTNFYTAYGSENMPEFVIDGNVIPGEAFFAALGEDLMPAAGNTSSPQGSGSGVGTKEGTLHEGLDARDGADAGQNNQNDNEPTTTFNLATGEVVTTNDSTGTTDNTGSDSDSGSGSSPAPQPNPYSAANDVLSADTGANLTGNLLANDDLPAGSTITTIEAPAGWTGTLDETTGAMTFTKDGTSITINQDGDYELTTNFATSGIEDVVFNYVAQDQDGNSYEASITVGNAGSSDLYLEKLQGTSAIVTDNETGNTYEYKFADYSNDSTSYNQHINGMLLGEGSDTITVDSAIGSQSDLYYADAKGEDTFIYGDFVNAYEQEDVGNDVINVGTLDGTKIRADGHLHNDVVGGNDTINVENMENGSIMGDGWNLHDNSKGGDDEINIGTMNSGEVFGDGRYFYGNSEGGDDKISVETIDTTEAGRQEVEIFAGSGDDTVSVDSIQMGTGDYVKIDGGLGDDIFNFNDSADNTMAIRGDNIYIAGNNASITNFEGVSTGGGDDLLKLYSSVDDIISIDTGDGMDVLLANVSDLSSVSDKIESGDITNAEVILFSNSLNNSNTTSTDDLFNKLDGVSQDENGQVTVGEGWTQNADAPSGYSSFTYDGGDTNASNDMTILVAQTQLTNTAT